MSENKGITQRELQILNWIKQNPLISQAELAKLANISRSSAAVHISNLMKKGYLRGKGYIISPKNSVAIIGGINFDILGAAERKINPKTSNPGRIRHAIGGLGRNIALNLVKLGVPNYFITVYGNDAEGEMFKQDALKNGMDITYAKQLFNAHTSNYLYLNEASGERFVGLDDMKIFDKLTPEFLTTRLTPVQNSEIVGVDANLPEETLKWLTQNYSGPIFAKAVSLNKTLRFMPILDKIDTLVINSIEVLTLTGITANDERSARYSAEKLFDLGIKNLLIYIDEKGVLYGNRRQLSFLPEPATAINNTNGCGAAATASLIQSRLQHLSFEETAKNAATALYLTAGSYDPVNDELSIELINETKRTFY